MAAYFQKIPGWYLDVGMSAKLCDRTDGRIVTRFNRESAPEGRSIPAVNVSNVLADPGLPTVVSDDLAVGDLAARYFIDRGQRSFAAFAPCNTHYAHLRVEGFTRTLKARGFEVAWVGHPNLFDSMRLKDVAGNILRVQESLAELSRPCAIFAVDDLRAALLCRIALAAGYEMPGDFLLLGVDDNRIVCESTPVPLSSVRLDSRTLGLRAAELLAGLIEGRIVTDPDVPLRIEIPPLDVVERASTEETSKEDPLVRRAMNLIEQEFHQPLRVDALASRLGVTTRYLQMRFRASLKISPQQALLARRLREAKTLLVDSSLSVTEIAYACGFGDYKQMAVHLRRECGETASAYRKSRRCMAYLPKERRGKRPEETVAG
ncbi:MAG: substrate-binding domain-containing protein [Opitutales bacterium]|nr:substrate-binding domain-containing protein [Opitutales bacterium]